MRGEARFLPVLFILLTALIAGACLSPGSEGTTRTYTSGNITYQNISIDYHDDSTSMGYSLSPDEILCTRSDDNHTGVITSATANFWLTGPMPSRIHNAYGRLEIWKGNNITPVYNTYNFPADNYRYRTAKVITHSNNALFIGLNNEYIYLCIRGINGSFSTNIEGAGVGRSPKSMDRGLTWSQSSSYEIYGSVILSDYPAPFLEIIAVLIVVIILLAAGTRTKTRTRISRIFKKRLFRKRWNI